MILNVLDSLYVESIVKLSLVAVKRLSGISPSRKKIVHTHNPPLDSGGLNYLKSLKRKRNVTTLYLGKMEMQSACPSAYRPRSSFAAVHNGIRLLQNAWVYSKH